MDVYEVHSQGDGGCVVYFCSPVELVPIMSHDPDEHGLVGAARAVWHFLQSMVGHDGTVRVQNPELLQLLQETQTDLVHWRL